MKTQMMIKAAGAMMLVGALMISTGQAEAAKKSAEAASRGTLRVASARTAPSYVRGGYRLPEDPGLGPIMGIERGILWDTVLVRFGL